MRRRSPLLLSALAALLLTVSLSACAVTAPAPQRTSTAAPSVSSQASPTTSTTPSSGEPHRVILAPNALAVDGGDLLPDTGPEQTVAALTALYGASPTTTTTDDKYGQVTRYDWEGVTAVVVGDRVTVTATQDSASALFVTKSGVGLGATRAAVEAAGATMIYDDNGTLYLAIDEQDAPGTTSLRDPEHVGVDYVTLKIVDGVVVSISTGGNDYSDI